MFKNWQTYQWPRLHNGWKVTVVTTDLKLRFQPPINCRYFPYRRCPPNPDSFYIRGLGLQWPWPWSPHAHRILTQHAPCMLTGPVTVVTEDLWSRYQCTIHCTFHMPGVLTSRFFYIGGLSTRWPWPHNGLSQWYSKTYDFNFGVLLIVHMNYVRHQKNRAVSRIDSTQLPSKQAPSQPATIMASWRRSFHHGKNKTEALVRTERPIEDR